MAGALCPNCKKKTLFLSPEGRTCTQCGFIARIPTPKGKGKFCVTCKKYQVFNDVCKSCGTKYEYPTE